jgi:hypothetical protein
VSSSSPWLEPAEPDAPTPLVEAGLLRRSGAGGAAQPEAATQPERRSDVGTIEVIVRLVDGDRLLVGRFSDADEAKQCAEALVQSLGGRNGSWPFVGGRFLRPDAIVSVDVAESGPKWTGSADRAATWAARQHAQ